MIQCKKVLLFYFLSDAMQWNGLTNWFSWIFLPVWYHTIKSSQIQVIFWRLKDSHKLVLNYAQPCFTLFRAGIMSICESICESIQSRTLFLHSFCIGLIVICALSKYLPVKITERQSLQTQRCITISILAMLLSENVWPREVSASNSTIRLKIIACADL